jgi:hypothetical protein
MPLGLLQMADVRRVIELTVADHSWLPYYAGGSAIGPSATDAYGQAVTGDNGKLSQYALVQNTGCSAKESPPTLPAGSVTGCG